MQVLHSQHKLWLSPCVRAVLSKDGEETTLANRLRVAVGKPQYYCINWLAFTLSAQLAVEPAWLWYSFPEVGIRKETEIGLSQGRGWSMNTEASEKRLHDRSTQDLTPGSYSPHLIITCKLHLMLAAPKAIMLFVKISTTTSMAKPHGGKNANTRVPPPVIGALMMRWPSRRWIP